MSLSKAERTAILEDVSELLVSLGTECRSASYSSSWATWYDNIQTVPYDELAEALQQTMNRLEATTAEGIRIQPYPFMAQTVMEWCDRALDRDQSQEAVLYLEKLFLSCYHLMDVLAEEKEELDESPDEGPPALYA